MNENETPSCEVGVGVCLENVDQQILEASKRAGRDLRSVTLVAVSKMQPILKIKAALIAGHRIFGENRVQEANTKWPKLKIEYPEIQLHLIGPLQTNKIKQAVSLFDVIETVDRSKLAINLKREMDRQGRNIPCLVQVNTGEEVQKSGIIPEQVPDFIDFCQNDVGLNILGLMCIPPAGEEPALHFSLLRKIASQSKLGVLSMGMSGDFETAIELGATHIRVGSAIFGSREGT